MWAKTLVGFFISLLLNMSLMLNIAHTLPIPRQIYLLTAFVGGIFVWAGIMTVFYCADNIKRPMLYCGPLLLVSAGVNALFILGVV